MTSIRDAAAAAVNKTTHTHKCPGCGEMRKMTYGQLFSEDGYQCECGQVMKITHDADTGEPLSGNPFSK